MLVQIDDSSCDERHEGIGTGLALVTEEVLAEARAILEPPEPYYELHQGAGTGMDLDPAKVIRQARAIVLESWQRERVTARQAVDSPHAMDGDMDMGRDARDCMPGDPDIGEVR